MQTLASDLEYILLNKLVPFEVDDDELHALVDDTVAHVNKLLSCCKKGSQGEAKAYVDNFCDEIVSDWDMCLMSEEPTARLWQAVIESIINWLSEDVDLNTYNDANRQYLGNSIIVLVGMVYADASYYRAGLSTFETGIAHAVDSTSRANPSTSEAPVQDAASDTSADADALSSTHSNSSGAYSDCTEDKKGKSRRTADYKGKPRWLENTHYDQNGSDNDKENDGQTTPQKRKADEVFNTNDDKTVGSPRKKPWEQDSIAETGFLGTADEHGPDKEAGEELDMDKLRPRQTSLSELDQNMDFEYEKPEMDDEEQDGLKTDRRGARALSSADAQMTRDPFRLRVLRSQSPMEKPGRAMEPDEAD